MTRTGSKDDDDSRPEKIDAEDRQKLRELRCFNATVSSKVILRPILSKAVECRVYGLKKDSKLRKLLQPVATEEDGFFSLNTGRELIEGFEPLWKSTCEHWGIAIVTMHSPKQIEGILAHCCMSGVWSSLHQLQEGNSKAAIAFCQAASRQRRRFVFFFSGTNGLEWLDVFGSPAALEKLMKFALRIDFERENRSR
jgi:hypothetical protein